MNAPSTPAKASVLYSPHLWRGALMLSRSFPHQALVRCARLAAGMYWRLHPKRRQIITDNLLPAHPDRASARVAGRELFHEFGEKLADLWRCEAGLPTQEMFSQWNGWENFLSAKGEGRGVLLLTIHLGNWEFGGPLMRHKGEKLKVLTLAEPGNGFTEMRMASRARQGVETIVVGNDAFSFIEIIKELQSGANVALLVDRPPARSAVQVSLFGRAFLASVAPAELARSTGAALLPVYIVKEKGGYAANMLPEIPYDRSMLGNRAARIELTQRIVSTFEPAIRRYITQWYHFVPIWPVGS